MVGASVGLGVSQDSTQFAGQFSIKFFFLHLFFCCVSVSAGISEQKNGSFLYGKDVELFSHPIGEEVGGSVGERVGDAVGPSVGLGVSQDSTQFAGQFSIKFFFLHLFFCCVSVSAGISEQ